MKVRISTVVNMALMLALLAASLPMDIGIAQGNQPNCPPYAQLKNIEPGFTQSVPKECLKQAKQPASPQLMTLNQISPLSSGGPDDFGYIFDDTVPFNWVTLSELGGFTGADDYALGPIDFGSFFTFPFYGSTYSDLYISSNGLITFGQGSCCDWGGSNIPSTGTPNNFIAPFWEDLFVGSPANNGSVWYAQGGVAPDRYFAVEWRDGTTYTGSDPFSFQVLIYENGDILVQIQSLPASYYSTVGIENATGDDGLQYQAGDTGLSVPIAIKFIYPTAPTPRLQILPLSAGKFASTTSDAFFPLTIKNTGSAGSDTYDLTTASSWAANLYQDGCVTPLTDTDADTTPDTGPIPEGSSTTICVGFTPPSGAGIGDMNNANVTVTSSLDPAKTKSSEMSMVIPTSFAQVFEDYEDAAMAFRISQPESTLTNYVTNDFHYGDAPATIGLPDGTYMYIWHRTNNPNGFTYSDIEFTFVSGDGTTSTPVEKLTNNVNNRLTMDFVPAVAVTPDGTIGVLWYRFLADNPNGTFVYNFNIYFAALSATGSLLSGPTNVTNNTLWDDYDNLDVPHFYNPAIAATNDNRFVLGWEDQRTDGAGTFFTNIWYSILDTAGTNVFAPILTSNFQSSYDPYLNTLNDGNVMLTFHAFDGNTISPYYAVIASDGTLPKPVTNLDPNGLYYPFTTPDAVALSDGNTALAWPTFYGVALGVLDPTYNVISGPTYAYNPYAFYNQAISLTRDAEDHIIMTWLDFDSYPSTHLFYALADSAGTFITNPIPMRISVTGLVTSENGQGNAPYPIEVAQEPLEVGIDIRPGSTVNPVNTKSMGVIPVAILSTPDFDALSMVDISSLTFGRTGDENSLAFCNTNGTDANDDGLPDLTCFFQTQATGFQPGDDTGILKGAATDGSELVGHDLVRVLK